MWRTWSVSQTSEHTHVNAQKQTKIHVAKAICSKSSFPNFNTGVIVPQRTRQWFGCQQNLSCAFNGRSITPKCSQQENYCIVLTHFTLVPVLCVIYNLVACTLLTAFTMRQGMNQLCYKIKCNFSRLMKLITVKTYWCQKPKQL